MENTERVSDSSAFRVFAVLIPLCCICNFAGSFLFDNFDTSQLKTATLCFVIGTLISEVCLLAIWLSLGAQRIEDRVFQAIGTLGIVIACYLFGLVVFADGDIPEEAFLWMAGSAIGLFLLLAVPLWLYRFSSRTAINLQHLSDSESGGEQFSIRFLLGITTFAAVLIAAVNRLGAEDGLFSEINNFGEIFRFFTFNAFFPMMISLPTVWIALSKKQFWLGIPILAFILAAGPILGAAIFCGYISLGSGFDKVDFWQTAIRTGCYGIGVFVPTLATLLVFRALGFRLTAQK